MTAPPFPKQVQRHQPLAKYTAARLGGPADYLYIAKEPGFHETLSVLRIAWSYGLPVTVIGGGANVLVADKGVRGLTVINRATQICHEASSSDILVSASSGSNLIRLVRYCQERGFGGLEWAIAVPGTVGGAVVNNAGAHGGDMASSLCKALVYEARQGETWYDLEDLKYAYRYSELKARVDKRFFVMAAVFQLSRAQPSGILRRMNDFSDYRKRTQPPGASLGSIFKNPPGDYAGRLIEAADLKGYRMGDVQVSPVHANFFVNIGDNATASDYYRLIKAVRGRVEDRFGTRLELEIQTLGEWD